MADYNMVQWGLAGTVKFVGWNVGLGGAIKQSRVFAHLIGLNADNDFLQWQVFHPNFNRKARGTAIIINKMIHFSAEQILSDPGGHYITVSGTLFQTPVILTNVYAPNWDNPNFISSIIPLYLTLTHSLIFSGDLNLVIDPKLDRSQPKTLAPSGMARVLSILSIPASGLHPP